jgi:hypothetical protein
VDSWLYYSRLPLPLLLASGGLLAGAERWADELWMMDELTDDDGDGGRLGGNDFAAAVLL